MAFIRGRIVGPIGAMTRLEQYSPQYSPRGRVTGPQSINSTTIQLRHQSFDICLEDKQRVGTLIRQNLQPTSETPHHK